jgi:hypothetical protein
MSQHDMQNGTGSIFAILASSLIPPYGGIALRGDVVLSMGRAL